MDAEARQAAAWEGEGAWQAGPGVDAEARQAAAGEDEGAAPRTGPFRRPDLLCNQHPSRTLQLAAARGAWVVRAAATACPCTCLPRRCARPCSCYRLCTARKPSRRPTSRLHPNRRQPRTVAFAYLPSCSTAVPFRIGASHMHPVCRPLTRARSRCKTRRHLYGRVWRQRAEPPPKRYVALLAPNYSHVLIL